MFNSDNYVYFVSKRQYGAPYGFTNYSDADGNLCQIVDKKDKDGNPIPRRFAFSRKERAMRIPKLQKGAVCKSSVVDFLRNHPECEGSPNGHYAQGKDGKLVQYNVMFKELNEGKDADIAINAKATRIEAENKAISLEGQDLEDLCALIGVFSKSPSIQKHRVLEFAGNEPDTFLALFNSPDRTIRSLVRKSISAGVLTQRGKLITWEQEIIGSDENEAVSKLSGDKKLLDAVEKALKRIK